MAYDSRVFRVLIASPSDVETERDIVVKVIQEWNDLHSCTRRVVLLPLRWETHSAPEYGTRPQEVLNRQIVDHCDLLVGIFWTRIGSPTGRADSGTLEEIERVGQAGKPIMLYFSKVGADPDGLDLDQMKRLNSFKERTYPNGLNESYKSHLEFRDKFAKQLELKLRDIQKADDAGPPPLSLGFLSVESGQLVGNRLQSTVLLPCVSDFESALEGQPASTRTTVESSLAQRIKECSSVPVVLAISNQSAVGVRSLFVELDIGSTVVPVTVADTLGQVYPTSNPFRRYDINWVLGPISRTPLEDRVASQLAHYRGDGLLKEGDLWKFTIEWDALQPQRVRLARPFFVTTQESTTISITARVFAESFAQPVVLNGTLEVTVEKKPAKLTEILPDLESIIKGSQESPYAIRVGGFGDYFSGDVVTHVPKVDWGGTVVLGSKE